jgi:serine/threonine protein kinase/tetratricopeptide (TPR) repeat protein
MFEKGDSRYQLLEKLGQGGMGVVYKALDRRLHRTVAIKMLPPELALDEARKKRFMMEAQAASALSHPNICTIHDIDEIDDSIFIVMEYISGNTLREKILQKQLNLDQSLRIAIAVGDALDKVHRLNIIHRDIKPANIMLSEESQPKIVDFGLANAEKRVDPLLSNMTTLESSLTKSGAVAGTISYMSPEQIRAEELDVRSDIFSFGILLYEMLAGQSPFSGTSPIEIASSILRGEPRSLSEINPSVPTALTTITKKALTKERESRYQSMKDLVKDLQDLEKKSVKQEKVYPQVAVLYFENMSKATEDEYLRDGMTEDIIAELWKIKDLKVFPRSAVAAYRDKSTAAIQIGKEMNATHVLEGSVRRSGNRLRITPGLVEIATGHTLWTARLDREMKDIFEVQDEIASSIAQALRITLSAQEESAIAIKPTENAEAYDYYLRARGYLRRRTKSDLGFALEMFEHAIRLDPKFAHAYAGVGLVSGILYYWHGGEQEWVDRGLQACERALTLVPELPEALATRATIYYGTRRYEESIRDARRAIELQPNNGIAFFALGLSLFSSDRFQEAAALAERACQASGDEYTVYLPYYNALERCGDTERADALRRLEIQELEHQLESVPEDVRARVLLSQHYIHFGKRDEGIQHLEKAISLQPDDRMVLYNAACVYSILGEKEKSLKILIDVVGKGFQNLDWVARDPDLNILHGDPRFEALIKKDTN